MNEFHKAAAMQGLKDMLEGDHFSICDLRSALEITGGKLSTKDEAAFKLLHCVKWKDMPPELRQMTQLKILEVLNDQPILATELIASALDGKSPILHGCLLN